MCVIALTIQGGESVEFGLHYYDHINYLLILLLYFSGHFLRFVILYFSYSLLLCQKVIEISWFGRELLY